MKLLLVPGMRLMRRLPIFGKFAVALVLLTLPLAVSLGATLVEANRELRVTDVEREGIAYSAPLVRLLTEVWLSGDSPQTRAVTGVSARAIADVDAADSAVGDDLGVHEDWVRLRAHLADLRSGDSSDAVHRLETAAATQSIRELIDKVADATALRLDPEPDSYPLIITLVDHVPDMVSATGEAHAVTQDAGSAQYLSEATDALRTSLLESSDSLVAAVHKGERTSSGSLGAEGERLVELADHLDADAKRVALAMTSGAAENGGWLLRQADLARSTVATTYSLESAISALLDERASGQEKKRDVPVFASLVVLAAAMYMALALYQSAGSDLRNVMQDIERVTEGGILNSDALTGTDELAQISRAIVDARDQVIATMGELSYLARHDELTSLGNRRLLLEKLDELLSRRDEPREGTAALLVVDIDGWRDLSESFGDAIGDQVLLHVTRRLHRATGRRDLVARIAGQHFAVLLPSMAPPDAVLDLAAHIMTAVEQPIPVGKRRLHVRGRAGVRIVAPDDDRAEDVHRDAEVAKAQTAGPGKPQVLLFAARMREAHRDRVELSAELVQAIDEGELLLNFQPVIDLKTDRLHGFEALVRWRHPRRGLVPPDVFIPLAETTGLIEPLGRWVLHRAATQLAEWTAAYPAAQDLVMNVNISRAQLGNDSIVDDVVSVLEDGSLDPRRLVLEITETALMGAPEEALRHVRRLAALGVTLALDDFGTGYSSLGSLRSLPVSIIKIDKMFMPKQQQPEESSIAFLRSIVAVGEAVHLATVAEGIETTTQADQLRAAGCTYGQGYLYGRPMPAHEVRSWLDACDGGAAPWPMPGGSVPAPRHESGTRLTARG